MTTNFALLLGGGIALFLAGVNIAFLLQLGGSLVGWFKFKIFAISLLLIYITLSFTYGQPDTSRVIVGWTGLALDLFAVFWMWVSIERAHESGVLGLVPLFSAEKGEKGEQGEPGPAGPRGPRGRAGRDAS